MFSGIVEDLGKIVSIKKIPEGFRFRLKAKKAGKSIKKSDSLCVNGVCHTIVAKKNSEVEFVTMHETLKKTNMGELKLNDEVNLERSLKVGGELGGHFVFGHIDDTGIVSGIKNVTSGKKSNEDSDNWEFRIKIHKKYRKHLIYVGSVAINGVSLTVADISPLKGNFFEIMVAIIPYTYNNTNFKNLRTGDRVNIEFDFLGKYVQNVVEKINQK